MNRSKTAEFIIGAIDMYLQTGVPISMKEDLIRFKEHLQKGGDVTEEEVRRLFKYSADEFQAAAGLVALSNN